MPDILTNPSSTPPPQRGNAILKAVTALIGLGIFVFIFVFFVRESTKVTTWRNSGTLQSRMVSDATRSTNDNLLIALRIDPDDFTGIPFPVPGDTILRLNDSAATVSAWDEIDSKPQKAGTRIPIAFVHEGREYSNTMVLRFPDHDTSLLIQLIQWLRFLVALAFTSVGLWAFLARPDSQAVRIFALFCFSMTMMMIVGVRMLSTDFATFTPPYFQEILSGLGVFVATLGGFWLNLQLLFPRPTKFIEQQPIAAYAVCYILPALLMFLMFFGDFFGLGIWRQPAFNFTLIVLIATGFVVMSVRRHRTHDSVERRQMRLVFWGSVIGLGMLALLVFVAGVFGEWLFAENMRPLILINLSFMGLLLTPLAYAYAFGRYRLLEVQGKLKRGTRYILVTVLVLTVLFGAAYGLGELIVRQMNTQSHTPTFILALILALGVGPARKKLQLLLEDRFYPERKRLRETLGSFLDHTSSIVEHRIFWTELESRLRDGLGVQTIYPVLAGTNGQVFRLNEQEDTPFLASSIFVGRLLKERRPVLVDELMASGRIELSDEENRWLLRKEVTLVLPLVTQTRIVGFLGIGRKSEEDDYAPEELNVLGSLASQVALASENLRLLEDNISKRRLEEQMEIARKIQEGFLPRTLPDTPRLEIAAGSRFSLEVAGDYYDVITLEGGETVVAVGDVSGKGAGAALIMANLQASLRTAIRMGVPLSEAISRVNELIFNNTPPEQFITCFVGMYSPDKQVLTYVNAGHNSPILVRADGEVERLAATGLILGILPDVQYEFQSASLGRGDILLMFTDGVSEAMNDAEEEYGEDRIVAVARKLRHASTKELLTVLERDVNDFCGRVPTEDDSTLVVIKRI